MHRPHLISARKKQPMQTMQTRQKFLKKKSPPRKYQEMTTNSFLGFTVCLPNLCGHSLLFPQEIGNANLIVLESTCQTPDPVQYVENQCENHIRGVANAAPYLHRRKYIARCKRSHPCNMCRRRCAYCGPYYWRPVGQFGGCKILNRTLTIVY